MKADKKDGKKLDGLAKIEEVSNENEEIVRLERRKRIMADLLKNEELLDNPLKIFEQILHEEGVDQETKLDLFLCKYEYDSN
jgi:hypothetical protein